MTGVLLDTNAALWLVADPDRLGPECRALLSSGPVVVSAASLWEVELKRAVGKLHVDADLAAAWRSSGVAELPVRWEHVAAYSSIDLPQRDPFDRLLLAQARAEQLDFVTADRQILGAGLPRVHDARS